MGTQSLKETNLPPEYGETGDIKTDVYNRLRQNGFTDSEAAGITGNIAQESMFDTEALSKMDIIPTGWCSGQAIGRHI